MKISTYHLHTKYCDGKNTAEEMILSAIEKGCHEIGFSGHAYLDIENTWAMTLEGTEQYKKEISYLKEKYKDKIKIYLGIEQDYFSPLPTDEYDFVIGSVHYVKKDGKYLPVDISKDEVDSFVNECYDGDYYAYAEDYYKLVSDVYNKTKCDIIGHVDLVTKFNEGGRQFSTENERYRKSALDAVENLLLTPAIFEINTGAISRGYRKEPYPEDFLLDRIAKSRKPFVVNSDTHNVDTVAFLIEETKNELDKKGYTYINSLEEIL